MRPSHFSRDSIAHRRATSKSQASFGAQFVAQASSTQTRFAPSHPSHPAVTIDEADEERIRSFSFPPSPQPDPLLQGSPPDLGPGPDDSPSVTRPGASFPPSSSSSHQIPSLGAYDETPTKHVSPHQNHRLSPSLPYPPYVPPSSSPSQLPSSPVSFWEPRTLLRLLYSNLRRYPLAQLTYAAAFTLSLVTFLLALAGVGYTPASSSPDFFDPQIRAPVVTTGDMAHRPHAFPDAPLIPKVRVLPISVPDRVLAAAEPTTSTRYPDGPHDTLVDIDDKQEADLRIVDEQAEMQAQEAGPVPETGPEPENEPEQEQEQEKEQEERHEEEQEAAAHEDADHLNIIPEDVGAEQYAKEDDVGLEDDDKGNYNGQEADDIFVDGAPEPQDNLMEKGFDDTRELENEDQNLQAKLNDLDQDEEAQEAHEQVHQFA